MLYFSHASVLFRINNVANDAWSLASLQFVPYLQCPTLMFAFNVCFSCVLFMRYISLVIFIIIFLLFRNIRIFSLVVHLGHVGEDKCCFRKKNYSRQIPTKRGFSLKIRHFLQNCTFLAIWKFGRHRKTDEKRLEIWVSFQLRKNRYPTFKTPSHPPSTIHLSWRKTFAHFTLESIIQNTYTKAFICRSIWVRALDFNNKARCSTAATKVEQVLYHFVENSTHVKY